MEELKVGLIINQRYRLIQYVGSGSFGEVWMAHDEQSGKNVAIKIYLSLDEKGREEFLVEYQIALGLNHPNLLTTQVYDTWGTRPFLVMKYCAMGAVTRVVGNLHPNILDEFFMWRFIHDVAAGLAYLHNQNPDPIVHQDIKPDNILVDDEGHFLISDFGISKRIRSTLRAQSSRALKAGATAYMGPERFAKNPAPITASDIWSLGASIFEMIEGELPFSGMGGVMQKNGAEMAELSDGWSEELNRVMQSCMAKETWDRIKAFELENKCEGILNDFKLWYERTPKRGVAHDSRSTQRHANNFVASDNPFSSHLRQVLEEQAHKAKKVDPQPPTPEPETIKPEPIKQKQEEPKAPENSLPITPTKNRIPMYLGGAVAIAGLISVGVFMMKDNTDIPKALEMEYNPLCSSCISNIEEASEAEYQGFIKANSELSSIDSLESLYAEDHPELFNKAHDLHKKYEEKAIPAAKAWATAARMQIEHTKNYQRATEYYDISLKIHADEAILKERDDAAKLTTP